MSRCSARLSGEIGLITFEGPAPLTDFARVPTLFHCTERTVPHSFAIITWMDFSHPAPQFTPPTGCRARIDSRSKEFAILDPAVC